MITTNTGAKKIEGTDNWRQIFDDHNDSVDAHDKMSDAMTYVVCGNKSVETVSIPVGAYFRLVNSQIVGRSDGLYTAKVAIPVDTVIDSSYFNEASPIVGGVANALNDNLTNKLYSATSSIVTFDVNSITKSNIIISQFIFKVINTISSAQIITFPFTIPANIYLTIRRFTTNEFIGLAYTTSSGIAILSGEYVPGVQYICELIFGAIN